MQEGGGNAACITVEKQGLSEEEAFKLKLDRLEVSSQGTHCHCSKGQHR